jgi:hypothetical protein
LLRAGTAAPLCAHCSASSLSKSFTAKDAKEKKSLTAKEKKSFTAKDAKAATD